MRRHSCHCSHSRLSNLFYPLAMLATPYAWDRTTVFAYSIPVSCKPGRRIKRQLTLVEGESLTQRLVESENVSLLSCRSGRPVHMHCPKMIIIKQKRWLPEMTSLSYVMPLSKRSWLNGNFPSVQITSFILYDHAHYQDQWYPSPPPLLRCHLK